MVQTVELKDVEVVDGHLLVKQDGGKYDAAVARGRVFSQTTVVLGLAIPIYTATAPLGNVLWNPAGSGVGVKLIDYSASWVSGTAAYGGLALMAKGNMPAAIATGALITAFAETAPVNGLFGGGQASKIRSSNAGTVTVTALANGDAIQPLGSINLEAQTSTARGTISPLLFDFDGKIVLLPGTLAFVACRVASVALYCQTFRWEEYTL